MGFFQNFCVLIIQVPLYNIHIHYRKMAWVLTVKLLSGEFHHAWLTHCSRVMHICVGLNIIGSDNGMLSCRHQAIIQTNVGILLTGPLATNLSKILIEIIDSYIFIQEKASENVICKMAAMSQPQCVNEKSTSVQVTAWCHQATSHYLSQYWPGALWSYGFTYPQSVKGLLLSWFFIRNLNQMEISVILLSYTM